MSINNQSSWGLPAQPTQPTQPASTAQPAQISDGGGCLAELGWFAGAFVLPCASFGFYRRAVRRPVASAVLFFIVFMIVISIVSTIGVSGQFTQVTAEIQRSFASGVVPEITIRNGVATVNGKQPAVLYDQSKTFIAIDTTGKYTTIDPSRYDAGFLLTRTELYILSANNGLRSFPLSQIQQAFNQDPLVINSETTARLWQSLSVWISLFVLLGFGFWNVVVRFIYLLVLSLIMWGLTSLFRPKTPYGLVLSVGIYAFVPVIYIIDVISRLGVSFFLLQTLILVIVWVVGLFAALSTSKSGMLGVERPLRAWRAWLGVPFLGVLALDTILSWKNGGWLDLLAGSLTVLLLAAAGLVTRNQAEATVAVAPVAPPPPVVPPPPAPPENSDSPLPPANPE